MPLFTRASCPESSQSSYTKSRSDVVPAGIANGAPPNVTVVEEPDPEWLPGLDVDGAGRTERYRVVNPGTSTRMMRSLRQLGLNASKLTE